MLKMYLLDRFLNGITMYRLMQWYLRFLFGITILFSFLRILPYNPFNILISGFYIIAVCYASNQLFAYFFKVKPNYESQFITGLILALIIGPLPLLHNVFFLTIAPAIAMASKYLIAINKQHVFNPAAFAVVVTAIVFGKGASWWIGSLPMSPFIIVGGIIMLRKIHRFNLTLGFLLTYLLFITVTNFQSFLSFHTATGIFTNVFLISPILFFSIVMLTEPLTSPANKKLRTYYGVFTAVVFILLQKFTPVSYTLELSLLIANVAGRAVRFNTKYTLKLIQKKEIAPTIWEFLFKPAQPFRYIAGQFLEWNLPHDHADNRGTRRYFTIASSPTEKDIVLAVKILDKPSSFKSALKNLPVGKSLYAASLEGDFTLGNNPTDRYVFIAGGIGVTPFRSMIKNLLDKKLPCSIILLYSAHSDDEFVFSDIFSKAEKEIGLKTVYIPSEKPKGDWQGEVGHIDEAMITKYVKEYKKVLYFISGPQPFVKTLESVLEKMGVKKANILTDYFPGYESI